MATEPLLIWTAGACAGPPGYGYGGWAWLMVQGETARGAAGGEGHTTSERMALRAVIEALKAVAGEPAAALQFDPGLARLAAELARREAADPVQDADLWNAVKAALAARSGQVRFGAEAAPTAPPRVFVQAWASFAIDKTKAKGAFTAAIPRPNLQTFMAKRGQPSASPQRARA